ncbi:hypothetical protein VaNZ11_012669, partial [Volvox africanus]
VIRIVLVVLVITIIAIIIVAFCCCCLLLLLLVIVVIVIVVVTIVVVVIVIVILITVVVIIPGLYRSYGVFCQDIKCDSFQDFWARRWNLTTTYMMRVLVYEPMIEGRLIPGGPRCTKLSAATAAASHIVAGKSPGRPPRQGAEEGADAGCLASPDEAATATAAGPGTAAAAAAENMATVYEASPTSAPPEAIDNNGLRQRRRAAESSDEAMPLQDGSRVNGGRTSVAAAAAAAVEGAASNNGSETGTVRPVSKLRRFVGLQAVFLFSGLWHILIFWYNTHVFSWRWCAFFMVQAPILTFERLLRQVSRKMGVRVPHALQVFAANFLLIAVARPLFFGPTDATGFAARNLEVGQAPLRALMDLPRALAERFGSSPH